MQADIGLIGLAVMGENLVMNMESKGFTVAVYNRTTEKVRKFPAGRAQAKIFWARILRKNLFPYLKGLAKLCLW